MPSQIDKLRVFCECLPAVPPDDLPMAAIMAMLDEHARTRHGDVSREALANCHGDWFEWLLGIAAWDTHREFETPWIAFPIPNVSQFDSASLYRADLYDMVIHLRNEVKRSANVELITSNPDFVIASAQLLGEHGLPPKILAIDSETIQHLKGLFRAFVGRCSFTDIAAYASVKFSLRPDRRLQIPHEGSLVKAMYVHLQTRNWITNPPPMFYFAIAANVSDADVKALRTVATHSITNVSSTPQPAVDEVFKVQTLGAARAVFARMLTIREY